MIPEATRKAGDNADLATVLGFAGAAALSSGEVTPRRPRSVEPDHLGSRTIRPFVLSAQ
jgi:hypothetical protein